MWETLKELVFSRNIVALIIVALMLVLAVRLITSTGRIVVYMIFIGLLGACLYYFFPEFVSILRGLIEPYFQ